MGVAWRWRTIEHTADLAVEVEAAALEQLFQAAAHALAGILCGQESSEEHGQIGAPPTAPADRELALEAPDQEALLVEWLRELLYLQTVQGRLLVGSEVVELEGNRLVARVALLPAAEGAVERELKGVTYHDLQLIQRAEGWFARVVFDL